MDTIGEELFHSVTRSSAEPTDPRAGVPVEELIDHPRLQPMLPRIRGETRSSDKAILLMEAMNDVAFGEAPELTPAEAEQFALDMWQATLKYYGPGILHRVRNIYEYMDDLRNDTGVTLDTERQIYVERAKRALDKVLN